MISTRMLLEMFFGIFLVLCIATFILFGIYCEQTKQTELLRQQVEISNSIKAEAAAILLPKRGDLNGPKKGKVKQRGKAPNKKKLSK